MPTMKKSIFYSQHFNKIAIDIVTAKLGNVLKCKTVNKNKTSSM